MTAVPNTANSTESRIETLIAPIIESLGYELVHVELHSHRSKTLRVYIDRARAREIDRARAREIDPAGTGIDRATDGDAIGIEDCATVSRAIDEPLEQANDPALAGGYELEVSSPGIDRPLRKPKDFDQFSGREARIHVFRPLTAEELGNTEYQSRNPKQKNFIGRLCGLNGTSVRLSVSASMGSEKARKKVKKPAKGADTPEKRDDVLIPLELISKANLEPDFEILEEKRK